MQKAQIAIGTDDVYKAAEAIRLCGGKITREPGPLPVINTKITACLDPDGWKSIEPKPSTKSSIAAPKAQLSHNAPKNDASSASTANLSVKVLRPSSSGGPVYDEKITELKLSIDSLEKERDFYFTKLRDIEILCQCLEIEHLPVVGAIKRILYATMPQWWQKLKPWCCPFTRRELNH